MKCFSFAWSIFVVFAILLLSYFVVGFQYESADGIHVNLFSGAFSDYPFNDFYYIALVGYGHILSLAYSVCPLVPWYDLLIYTLLLISGAVVLLVFQRCAMGFNISKKGIIFLMVTVVFFFLLPNMLLLNQTRSSIFISASGLLWIFHLCEIRTDKPIFKYSTYYLATGFFILGSLIRLEGGMATLIIFGCGGLFLSGKILESIKVLILPGALLLMLFVGFTLQGIDSEKFVHQVEPDIEYQISGKGNIVDLGQMNSSADSAKYMLAQRWIVNDPEHISIAFLRSIINDKHDIRERLDYTKMALKAQLLKHIPLNLLFLVLIFLQLFFLRKDNTRLSIQFFIFYVLSIFFVLLSMAYFVKIEERHWVPMLSVATMLILFYSLADYEIYKDTSIFFKQLFSFSFIVLFLYQLSYFRKISNATKGMRDQAKVAIERINAFDEGDYLLIDLSAVAYTFSSPFNRTRITKRSNIMLHNLGALSLSDQYKEYLDGQCSCNSSDYAEFYNFLYSLEDKLTIIGGQEDLELTMNYLKNVYHESYGLSLKEDFVSENNRFNFYQLERLSNYKGD